MQIKRKWGWKTQRRKDRQIDTRVGRKWQKKGQMDKGSEWVPLWWTERQRQTDKERERGMGLLWINDCAHQKMNVFPRSPRNSACKWKESRSSEEWIHKWINKPINKLINVKGRLWSMHMELCAFMPQSFENICVLWLHSGMYQHFLMFDVWKVEYATIFCLLCIFCAVHIYVICVLVHFPMHSVCVSMKLCWYLFACGFVTVVGDGVHNPFLLVWDWTCACVCLSRGLSGESP